MSHVVRWVDTSGVIYESRRPSRHVPVESTVLDVLDAETVTVGTPDGDAATCPGVGLAIGQAVMVCRNNDGGWRIAGREV